jgi:predicted esterase
MMQQQQPDGGDIVATPDAPPGSPQPRIPAPTGTCPQLINDTVRFAPAGMEPRYVKLHIGDHTGGPLVLYWHATYTDTWEAAYSLGDTLDAILADGGIVAAPESDPAAGDFEWFIVNQKPDQDDFLLADEIVACLAQAHMIDGLRIHSMGMSAGALQTTAMSYFRSDYIASVATYSGGLPPQFATTPEMQDPENKFSALIFDGGTGDNVFDVDFQAASRRYKDALTADGHYAALCEHTGGHDIPLDAAPAVFEFFNANPWGAWPSPYAASGLPASFPSYCD